MSFQAIFSTDDLLSKIAQNILQLLRKASTERLPFLGVPAGPFLQVSTLATDSGSDPERPGQQSI